MADLIVSQDPTKPGVLKVNGTPLASNGKIPLTGIDPTGAANGQVIVLAGGVWTAGAGGASADTASNLGGGAGVFSSKVGADFQFKSLVAGSNTTITPAATTITIASTATGPFSASFTSAQQVITSAGALTIAHGLGAAPTLVQAHLVNTVGESGYSIGDTVYYTPSQNNGSTIAAGISLVFDATNLVIRFGSLATALGYIVVKNTGGTATITNANWQIVFKAWR